MCVGDQGSRWHAAISLTNDQYAVLARWLHKNSRCATGTLDCSEVVDADAAAIQRLSQHAAACIFADLHM